MNISEATHALAIWIKKSLFCTDTHTEVLTNTELPVQYGRLPYLFLTLVILVQKDFSNQAYLI